MGGRGGTTFCLQGKPYFLRNPIVPKSHHTFVGKYGPSSTAVGRQTSDPSLGTFAGADHRFSYVTIRNLVIRNMPQLGIATANGGEQPLEDRPQRGLRSARGHLDRRSFQVINNLIHHNRQCGFTGSGPPGSSSRTTRSRTTLPVDA
jgi:hypothetical protein